MEIDSDGNPIAFHEVSESVFPMTVEILLDGEVIWSQTVEGPGALRIPGRNELGTPEGKTTTCRITTADGYIEET